MSATTTSEASLSRTGPPLRRAVMEQRWDDVTFLHWPYDPAVVQRLLPAGVQADTFDDAAWVSLVPFRMVDLRLPGRRPLPFGTFPEVNVRTYVRHGNRRGVWFFSLDIDRIAPTVVARACYRLPYCQGRVDHVRVGDLITTVVDRAWPRPTSPVVPRCRRARGCTDLRVSRGPDRMLRPPVGRLLGPRTVHRCRTGDRPRC